MAVKERMQAAQITAFGGPEVLEPVEVQVPQPKPGEVLVALTVAGINFSDIAWRRGTRGGDLPMIDGTEGAGTIAALGEGVTGLSVGERVSYWNPAIGSYAEYATCPAWRICKIPDGVDDATAATLMLQGFTAHYLANSIAPLGPGKSCLVHSGAGGVGQILIQLAKALGARALTTVGTEAKAEIAKSVGADATILYDKVDFAEEVRRLTDGSGVDNVYDAVGKATWQNSLKACKRRGMVVFYGGASGPVPEFNSSLLSSHGSLSMCRPTLADYVVDQKEIAWRAGELFGLVKDGRLKISIGKTYPLARAAEAHADLENRRSTGKLVLAMPG